MNIICDKTLLSAAIDGVSKAVTLRSTIPVLEGILLKAEGFQLTLTGYDLEMGIVTTIDANVKEPGEVVLNAKLLSSMVSRMPSGQINIQSAENGKTTIQSGVAQFEIQSMNPTDFPELPNTGAEETLNIKTGVLRDMIERTLYAVSQDEKKPAHTGELFEINGDVLKVVSLDGHRISIRKINLKNSYPAKKVVVPGKTLSEVSKILSGDADKDVNIFFTGKHIVFEFDNTVVVSRLIEGEYFKIDQMLSSDYETKVTINKRELLESIDRATLLVKEGDKKPIIIHIMDETMELKMNSTVGSMNEEIAITKQGKDLLIGFNPKFMIDALRVIDDEEIDIYLVNPKAPCFIKDSEEKYIYLILPVNFTTVS